MIAAALHLVACMVVFSVVERLWPSASPHKWWRRPLFVDLCSWLILPLAVSAGIVLAVLSTDALLPAFPRNGAAAMLSHARSTLAGVSLLIQIAIAFVAMDFLSYWIHRAYHRFPLLWAFHVVHHTSEHLDWLSTLRLHPVSQMLNTAMTAAILLLAGLPVKAVIAANALIGFSAVLAHANVPWTFGRLRHLFVSPVFHHWHHAQREANSTAQAGANFGAALSIWDRIFGTSLPHELRPTRFGVDDAPPPNLWNLFLHPILPKAILHGMSNLRRRAFRQRR